MTLNTERLFFAGCACLLLIFAVYDVIEDASEGAALELLFQDVLDAIVSFSFLAYIVIWPPLTAFRQNRRLNRVNQEKEAVATRWKQVAQVHLAGLGQIIAAEFDGWGLTGAERDVGLLLLKGYSMKEIAALRNVSERTARQQAATIDDKSNLAGRAALSAYFLEDLLLPNLDPSPKAH